MAEVPDALKPYRFHGVDYVIKGHEAVAECPQCGDDSGKFSIHTERGTYNCFKCAFKGNPIEFLRWLYEQSTGRDNSTALSDLARERKISYPGTLKSWGLAVSTLSSAFILPAYDVGGKLVQLYKYTTVEGKKRFLATPTFTHGMFGANLLPKRGTHYEHIYLAEGPWDGMIWWETAQLCGKSGTEYTATTGSDNLLANSAVLAVPGCNVFPEAWSQFFAGKHVHLLYDNDHPKTNPKTKSEVGMQGLKGMQKVVTVLSKHAEPPRSIEYLTWGEEGYSEKFPTNYDIRDHISSGKSASDRSKLFGELHSMLKPIPAHWVAGKTTASAEGVPQVDFLECTEWKTLEAACKLALRFNEGLDRALKVMLATVMSTKQQGDQLWVKIVGPASCVAKNTYIQYTVIDEKGNHVNHKGGDVATLYRRFHNLPQLRGGHKWKKNCSFYVPSVTDEGVVFRNKVTNVLRNGVKEVFTLTTSSGRSIQATADHKFMTPNGYKELDLLKTGDTVYEHNGQTQPKGKITPTRGSQSEVKCTHHPRARTHIVKEGGKEYSYNMVYRYWAVYEASENGLDMKEYLRIMNSDSLSDAMRRLFLWTIPEDMEIHHIDEDPTNDEIDNLQMVSMPDHKTHHSEVALEAIAMYVEEETVVSIVPAGTQEVYDIVVEDPYRNFIANGILVHNCGKSTLAEALSVNRKFVLPKSKLTGFHSGFVSEDGKGKDNSFIAEVRNKTFILKDGDTLLTQPNLGQILAEARDIYDRTGRTSYRNGISNDYEGINMTFLLCGTESLRALDSSELGERFLDCVIIDQIDEDEERKTALRVAYRARRDLAKVSETKMESRDGEEMVLMKRLTGGYIDYLCHNSSTLLSNLEENEESLERCVDLGTFVSYIRARPSTKQDEKVQREMCYRLVSQLTRLADCLAVVMNKTVVDQEVLRIVTRTAMDTARGKTLDVVRLLYTAGPDGLDITSVSSQTGITEDAQRVVLRFLTRIGVVKSFCPDAAFNMFRLPEDRLPARARYTLTKRLQELYTRILAM